MGQPFQEVNYLEKSHESWVNLDQWWMIRGELLKNSGRIVDLPKIPFFQGILVHPCLGCWSFCSLPSPRMGFWSLSCGRVYKELDRILCAAVRWVEHEMQTKVTFSSTPLQLVESSTARGFHQRWTSSWRHTRPPVADSQCFSSCGRSNARSRKLWGYNRLPGMGDLSMCAYTSACICMHSIHSFITGWWFGTFFIFPYIGKNHPNWLSYFSEG